MSWLYHHFIRRQCAKMSLVQNKIQIIDLNVDDVILYRYDSEELELCNYCALLM